MSEGQQSWSALAMQDAVLKRLHVHIVLLCLWDNLDHCTCPLYNLHWLDIINSSLHKYISPCALMCTSTQAAPCQSLLSWYNLWLFSSRCNHAGARWSLFLHRTAVYIANLGLVSIGIENGQGPFDDSKGNL